MNKRILIFSFLILFLFIVACNKKTEQTTTTTTLQETAPLEDDVGDLDNEITDLDDSSLEELEDFNDI